jgi:hypothetical protein
MVKVKIKDNPPSLPQAFRQSKKAMVDEESHKLRNEVTKSRLGGDKR